MRYDCRTHVSKLAAQTVTVRHQTKSLIAPLRSIERKKKKPNLGTSQYLSLEGGRGERGFEGGGRRVFRKNRRRIKRHQLSIKCRTIAGELSLRGEFYRDKNKILHLPPQGINNTDPLRKMALFRALFKKNFNFKETGKLID